MNKKIIAISFLLVAILFVSALAGTIVYYSSVVNQKNSEIALLNSQIANLTSQISNLTAQITNLTSASLVAALNVTEIPNITPTNANVPFPTMTVSIPFDSLWINCSVTNTGHVTAFNAGLHLVAYASDGTLEINMTVPLANGVFGTDYPTNAFVLNNPAMTVSKGGFGSFKLGSIGSLQLGSLDSGQTANVVLAIYHEGTVSNWTVTSVWTNLP
jgi:hypothetical protein